MGFEDMKTPASDEAERLVNQNRAYTEGMEELAAMKSIGEEEKNEVREFISDEVSHNFQRQIYIEEREKNPLLIGIKERLTDASEKIKERVEYWFIPSLFGAHEFAWQGLQELKDSFSLLAKDPNDPIANGAYEGWTSDEIKELYFVLYNEKL
jgi:hypothetical protein